MAGAPQVIALTDENFEVEVLGSDGPVLVDFTATWCAPCRELHAIVDAIAEEFVERVKVGRLDVDENPATKSRFRIRAVPTVMVFERGRQTSWHVGLTDRGRLLKLLGLTATLTAT